MGKNKLYKKLRKIAADLPVIMRSTKEVRFVSGAELIKEMGVTEVDGKPVDVNRLYRYNYPVQIAVNHNRALKTAVNTFGKGVVPHYLNAVERVYNKQQQPIHQ